MENVIENSINYVQQKYPEVRITKKQNMVEFEGRFIIDAKKNSFEIHEAPLLKIIMSINYPTVQPVCFDVDKIVTYDHVNEKGVLCLSTEIDVALKIRNSICISDFIDELVIPYFLSFRYWEKYGYDLFGDYTHGGEGIIESLKSYLNDNSISDEDCYYLLIWASKVKKFKKGIPRDKQTIFKTKYLSMMKKLRNLGLPLLKRQYQMMKL